MVDMNAMTESAVIRHIQGYALALGNGDISLSEFFDRMRQMEATPISEPQKLAPIITPRAWLKLAHEDKQ